LYFCVVVPAPPVPPLPSCRMGPFLDCVSRLCGARPVVSWLSVGWLFGLSRVAGSRACAVSRVCVVPCVGGSSWCWVGRGVGAFWGVVFALRRVGWRCRSSPALSPSSCAFLSSALLCAARSRCFPLYWSWA